MEEKPQWSQGGGLGEGGGEGRSTKESLPSTLYTYVGIAMSISTPCMGKCGKGEGAGESPPSAVCMYVTVNMIYIMM